MGEKCPTQGCVRRDYAFIPTALAKGLSEDDLYLGRLIDIFLLVKMLGKGGFGTVYLALMMPKGRHVALKILNQTPDDAGRERFMREAQSLAMLEDPHIVKLRWYGDYNGKPYMAMEYVADSRSFSKEIRDRVREGRDFTHTELTHIVHQLLNALKEAHSTGIIHRDIKPENILLQKKGDDPLFVKVLDFGLAKFTGQGSKMSMVLGTPRYMAPEQFSTNMSIGPWTDLYAVAAFVFELMTGQPLFARDPHEAFGQKVDESFDPVAKASEEMDLPARVIDFFRKGVAWRPKDRFRDTEEFRRAFDELLRSLRGQTTLNLSPGKLDELLDSSDMRRVREGSSRRVEPPIEAWDNSETLPFDEEDVPKPVRTQADISEDDLDVPLHPPWYKKGPVVMAGIILLGLVVAGFIVFRTPKKSEATSELVKVSSIDKTKTPVPVKKEKPVHVSKPILKNKADSVKPKIQVPETRPKIKKPVKPVLRNIEIRPMYKSKENRLKVLSGVKVFVDNRLRGVTTRAGGVQVKMGPGMHRFSFEGPTIEKKTVQRSLSAIKGNQLDIRMVLSW